MARLRDVKLVRGRAQRAARLGPAPVRFLQRIDDLLGHPMLRLDHDRTKGGEMGIGHAAIVNRHAEETGRAERLRLGNQLFQVPAERFLARVDAKHGLESRRVDTRSAARRV